MKNVTFCTVVKMYIIIIKIWPGFVGVHHLLSFVLTISKLGVVGGHVMAFHMYQD
jgi:hypothetical protein